MNQTEQKLGCSIRVEIEKLDGGYISNVTGKRRIYKDAHDIDDAININGMLAKIEESEYMLAIDLVPKELYQDFLNGADILNSGTTEDTGMSLKDKAIAAGIIKKADEFNPYTAPVEPDIHSPIVVTPKNAYSSSKLKSLPWKDYNEQHDLTIVEKAEICGVKKENMYQLWNNVIKGVAKFQSPDNRIAFTILAQYYERHLGIKNNTKDQMESLKASLLSQLRELELLTSHNAYTKSSAVATHIGKMRKLLL
jgi:hypothetical protein